jgi:hypothetical protein
MASCACCGKTVFFGKKSGGESYCSDDCLACGPIHSLAKTLPEHLVRHEADKIFKSACPVCRTPGATDVHASHTIWSALVVTSWNSQVRFSCKPCVKRQLLASGQSLLLGWWGFPWGILGTPITIGRNVWGMLTKIGAHQPSPALLRHTRSMIAARQIEQSRLAA